jgi:signal transduction histidine kinase
LHIEDSDGKPTNKIPLVQADRRMLREVVDHLLENAVLYSPEGGTVEIGLRTRRPEQVRQLSHMLTQPSMARRKAIVLPPSWIQDQPMAEIWVQDHGIGIAEEHLEQIFQRFYRVDTSLTREVNGLGLGLAICKQIVTLHHGLLWAESEVGKGSTFHVLLPMKGPVHQ